MSNSSNSETTNRLTDNLEYYLVKPKLRIEFLDSIRGLAALFVVLFHAYKIHDGYLGPPKTDLISDIFFYYPFYLFRFGKFAVVVFLVISGYSLMLPITRSATFNINLFDYFKRRFRRILPPYYVALILSLLVITFVPNMSSLDTINKNNDWNTALPVFDAGVLVSHGLMVHNWNENWILKINPPMWSVPIEFQLYFLFPIIFIPVWKKFGSLFLLCLSIILGLIPLYFFPNFYFESSWYITLFVMGMVGASINYSNKPFDKKLREKIPWGKMVFIFLIFIIISKLLQTKNISIIAGPALISFGPIVELFVGLAASSLIIFLTEVNKVGEDFEVKKKPMILKFLTIKPLLLLGSFSYSLYLIHNPIQAVVNNFSQQLGLTAPTIRFIEVATVTPLAIVLAYGFHLVFERPFLVKRL